MSKIPYQFDTPIPSYFRKNGWFKPDKRGLYLKNLIFIQWCFSRCSTVARKEWHDCKELNLEPYEFICGREKCAEETGLTDNEVRHRLNVLQKQGFLKKTTNSATNRYTCYKWVTERFLENDHQLENQQTTNRPPTDHQLNHHNLEYRSKNKEKKTTSSKRKEAAELISFDRSLEGFVNITDHHKQEWQNLFPGVEIERELLKMKSWLLDPTNPRRDGNQKFIKNWLEKAYSNLPKRNILPIEDPKEFIDIDPDLAFLLKERDNESNRSA